MSKFTAAYTSFLRGLGEVEELRRLAARKERADAIAHSDQINALCRGAVVLLCSHVEAYVKEVGEVALTELHAKGIARAGFVNRFFYHISKGIIEEIQETVDPDRLAEKVFAFIGAEGHYWSKGGPFPVAISSENFNKGFSNPGFKKIQKYFNRFGCADYRNRLAVSLAASYNAVTNMVDHMVDTRNKIAHGDPAATKTPGDLKDMMRLIRTFCMTTDLVFAGWCKTNVCCIR